MYQRGDYINFTLPGSDDKLHTTSDYKGQVIVLYTYPRDNTPGCTIEANGFKLLHDEFKKLNSIVLGLNNNTFASHQKFIEKYCLPFNLLIDENLELVEQLGAKKEESKVLRKTFIIDELGRLETVFDQVNTKSHAAEVLEYLKNREKH
ncbi:MAG: peroxiredoxin [Haloplasmataceae bacterium]|jgi:peroxiredoxin Q/BCP|nr:peroxiredoxin [Haloplasmataceae bacterium]